MQRFTFPQLRPESQYWRPASADISELPSGWQTGVGQQAAANQARADKIKFSGHDLDPSGGLMSPMFFNLDGGEYLTTQIVVGNQWVDVYVCRMASRFRVTECHKTAETAVSHTVFAPDYRHLVIWSREVEYGFKLFESPDLHACTKVDSPGERALAASFTPDEHLAVASQDGELWIYSLNSGCDVSLQRNVFVPQLANWPMSGNSARNDRTSTRSFFGLP